MGWILSNYRWTIVIVLTVMCVTFGAASFYWFPDLRELFLNISTEILGILVTVILVDYLVSESMLPDYLRAMRQYWQVGEKQQT